ncbi:MAG: transcriptional regulator [Actinomycetota bacterium]|nr:transcriptional regulator [Actinomycetota bacterium]
MDTTYARRVGERLRAIRLQKGLSLHEVESASGKEFKASVLGAYERGERSISVPRLQRLAQFYEVPVDQLLPKIDSGTISLEEPASVNSNASVCIDLQRLRQVEAPEADVLNRYLSMIQMARGDFNGKMLSVRADDVRALAAVFELTPEGLATRLDDLGIRASAVA